MSKSLPKISYGKIMEQNELINNIVNGKKGFLIVDQNTFQCREILKDSPIYNFPFIKLKAGEEFKNLEQISLIWEFLNKQNATRNDIVFCLGGGVINDMGGFAASTFKRGLSFVNIPTTLLSMVDASIGGKTGFNFNHYKNNIGTFNQPLMVFSDSIFLNTLPKKELLSGMAEVIKHAIIGDKTLWEYLNEKNINNIDFSYIIKTSSNLKLEVVDKDPFEKNIRKSLNLGHTVGHAIESYLLDENQPIMHGFAVAKGIIIEAFFAHKLNLLSKSDFEEINNTINKYFNNSLNFNIDVSKILSKMKGDKKNNSSNINFSLPNSIGKISIDNEISIETIEALLLEFLKND